MRKTIAICLLLAGCGGDLTEGDAVSAIVQMDSHRPCHIIIRTDLRPRRSYTATIDGCNPEEKRR